MDRKARDLESGRKKLEEYKRKKQAKGAALRQQLEAAAAGSGVAPPGDAASGRGGTFASPPRSADATRSKYQERLEAKLASVLGNTTNQAHAHPLRARSTMRMPSTRASTNDARRRCTLG